MAQTSIPLPVDVVVAKEFSADAQATTKLVADIADDDMILDIGPQTAAQFAKRSRLCRQLFGMALLVFLSFAVCRGHKGHCARRGRQ
jgi:hypothetical protein